jgi:plasmid stabilization system protein ParE
MDAHTPAEELPELYRAILDRVAELEAAGQRRAAGDVRRRAIATYSTAWDERARRQLLALLHDANRPTAAERHLGRGIRPVVSAGMMTGSPPNVAPER